MSLLKQDSIDDILDDQVNLVMNEVDPSPTWLVEDEEVQVFLTVNHTKKLLTNGVFDNEKWKINLPIFTSKWSMPPWKDSFPLSRSLKLGPQTCKRLLRKSTKTAKVWIVELGNLPSMLEKWH